MHLVDPDGGGDRVRGARVVAGEQHRAQAELAEPGDRLRAARLDRVADAQHAAHLAIPRDDDGGASARLGLRRGGDRLGGDVQRPCLGEPARAARDDGVAVDDRLDAEPGVRDEPLRRGRDDPLGLRVLEDRLRHRMLRAGFDPGCQAQQLARRRAADRGRGDDPHPAGGHGAGLVQHDRVDAARRLEHLRPADQDAQLRTATGAHHERGGGRESEGAGAGDDERRDGGRESEFDARAGQEPAREREEREAEDDGNEHRRDAVRESLHGGLAGLGLLDEAAEPGEFGVGSDARHLDHQSPADAERGADDPVARADLDRHGFAGQHARVDGGGALEHEPVAGDLLAGAHDDPVAGHERVDGHAHLGAGAQHDRVLGAQFEQRAQRGPRLRLGACLQVAPAEDEHGHRSGDLEVDLPGCLARRAEEGHRHLHAGHPRHAEEEGVQRPGEGGRDADADQGVHGGGAVSSVDGGGSVEGPGAPDGDRCGESEGEPLPVRELQRRDHREQCDRHGEGCGDDEPLTERAQFGVTGRRVVGRAADGRSGKRGRVAGGFDGGDQRGDVNAGGVDVRLLGGVVDARRDPVDLVELALDAVRAGGARHAADLEVDGGAHDAGLSE